MNKPEVSSIPLQDYDLISSHAKSEHKITDIAKYCNATDVDLLNKCSFRCIRCGFGSDSWKRLRSHVGRSHLPHVKKSFKLNPYEYAVSRSYHECHVCGENLLQVTSNWVCEGSTCFEENHSQPRIPD